MKTQSIKINSPDELVIIQKALFAAGGAHKDGSVKIKKTEAAFIFISENGELTFSSDPMIYEKRIEFEITLYDSIKYLQEFIKKAPFLYREGIKAKMSYQIDAGIKNGYTTMCADQGYNKEKRLENLIAADIKCRILGMDLISVVQKMVEEI